MISIPFLPLVVFAVAGTCGVLAGYVSMVMLALVNRKLPEERQIAYFGVWHCFEAERIFSEYKRLYPNGRLDSTVIILLALMGLFLIATMFAIVFTSPAFR
jgi:hypothetical protein